MSTHIEPSAGVVRLPAALRNLAELGLLLERIERRGTTPDAQQYRSLVEHILAELERYPRDAALDDLLACAPALGELYENLRYASAGLCLSPLERSITSEQQVRTLLAELARRGPAPS